MGEREIRAATVLKAARESDSIGTYNRHDVAMVAALLTHEAPRAALLDALGHGDCVSRDRADEAYRQGREHESYDRDGEIMRLRGALESTASWLNYVAFRCRQMGLDVGRDVSGESWLKPFADGLKGVSGALERARAALSADATADAEPGQATGMCGCGHYASQHGLGWKGCAYCNCPQYKDAEPSRAEGDEPTSVGTDTATPTGGGEPLGDDGRSRAIEAALTDLLYVRPHPGGPLCPHCGSDACYDHDPNGLLGVVRCSATLLPVTVSPDGEERLRANAKAVLGRERSDA